MASIMSITNFADKEQKRKNRWSMRFINVPEVIDTLPFDDGIGLQNQSVVVGANESTVQSILQLSLHTAARPSISVGEVEFHRLNEKYFYPEGKAAPEPLEVSFYDTIQMNAGRYMWNWFRCVYDPKSGAVGYKEYFAVEAHLYMLGPKGVIVEDWKLENCWPTTVNFNDLSYEDTAAAEINVTFRYDRAVPKFFDQHPMAAGGATAGLAADPYGIPGAGDFNQYADNVDAFPGPGGTVA